MENMGGLHVGSFFMKSNLHILPAFDVSGRH